MFAGQTLPLADSRAHRKPGRFFSVLFFKCSMDENKAVLQDEFQLPETNSATFA